MSLSRLLPRTGLWPLVAVLAISFVALAVQCGGQEVLYDFDFSTLDSDTLPVFLRQGIRADIATQTTAVEMYLQGWRYAMPRRGTVGGEVTWYCGYWCSSSDQVSATQPQKKENGLYYGDGRDLRDVYRYGWAPPPPTKLEWLLSESGGVKPID